MENVDKIVLLTDRSRCIVIMKNGTVLFINFFKLGMTYYEGLEWLKDMLNGTDRKAAA